MKIGRYVELIIMNYRDYFIMLAFFILALLEFFSENHQYSLLVVGFFVGLIIAKRAKIFIIIIFLIVICIISSDSMKTINDLVQFNLETIHNPISFVNNIGLPNSGRDILPKKVQQMVFLLENNHVSSYQISEDLRSNGLIYQRIIEVAWPIRKDEEANYVLINFYELGFYSDCDIVAEKGKIALVYCP
jgi:cation transport regulator ChaB